MTDIDSTPVYVRKAELAKLLSVSPRTIDNWLGKRVIPVIATSPRLHLFDVQAVRTALEERFETPSSNAGTSRLSIRWEKPDGQQD